jgi:hypothetical protein
MLGPSILLASLPFCVGYALNAVFYAKAKTPAIVGFTLATAELLVLVVLIVIAVMRGY